MRRRLIAAVAVVLTGCTPAQTTAWLAWHDTDPAAAEVWLTTDEAQQFLDDSDGPQYAEWETAHADRWERIAWCESGGNWSMHVHNSHGWFGGGLAIMDSAWRAYGGQAFAPHAGLATKAEQIVIAERIWDDVGPSAWQCR